MRHWSPNLLVLLALLAIAPERAAVALNFVPTDAEWAKWPEYCRARYTVSLMGRQSGLDVSADTVRNWELRMGPAAWYGLHHHCAALAQTDAGIAEQHPRRRASTLDSAVRNHQYMLNHLPSSDPMYPVVMSELARTYVAMGKGGDAMLALERAIAAQPASSRPYLEKASMLRKVGKEREASDVLLAADKTTNGKSADIKYAIGLDYYKQNQFERSRTFAREAYALGYPLPWLRDRLREKGYPIG